MAELCLMASHGYLPGPGLVFTQEQTMNRFIKDCQPFLPSTRSGQDVMRSGSLTLSPKGPWEPLGDLLKSNQSVKLDSALQSPVIVEAQDVQPSPLLFGSGIAEQCSNHQEIIELMSGSTDAESQRRDIPPLIDLVAFQAKATEANQYPFSSSLIFPHIETPFVDFVGDLLQNSKITIHPDGRVLLTECGTEIKDINSVIAEFYLSNNLSKERKVSMPIPYFEFKRSKKRTEAQALTATRVAPTESPETAKLKSSQKKKNRKTAMERERDMYRRNYFHTCESLLCLLVEKRGQDKTTFLSLKKAGPELPELLNKFSASIAGTGLAVLLSVICKVACGKTLFCTSKLFSTGLGFGLVWLSWAVNRLRDTVIYIGKNAGKLGSNEDEMMQRVDNSVKDIYFRAVTLVAVAMLRLA